MRRTGWTPVALAAFAFLVAMLGATLPTPLYPAYAVEFGFGELVSTVVFATYAIGVVFGLLVFGHWSDQVGRRPMLIWGHSRARPAWSRPVSCSRSWWPSWPRPRSCWSCAPGTVNPRDVQWIDGATRS